MSHAWAHTQKTVLAWLSAGGPTWSNNSGWEVYADPLQFPNVSYPCFYPSVAGSLPGDELEPPTMTLMHGME